MYLKINCPSCHKTYSVDPAAIQVAQPEFQCVDCGAQFWFSYPPEDISNVQTFLLQPILIAKEEPKDVSSLSSAVSPIAASLSQEAQLPTPTATKTEEKAEEKSKVMSKFVGNCPNCKRPYRVQDKECAYCGVVFSKKAKNEIHTERIQGNMILQKAWQSVIAEYESPVRHEAFLQICVQQNNFPYASQQYRFMLDANPNDEMALKMREKILQLATQTLTMPSRETDKSAKRLAPSLIIIGVGAILLLTGIMITGLRNITGFGAMLVALGFGFRYFTTKI